MGIIINFIEQLNKFNLLVILVCNFSTNKPYIPLCQNLLNKMIKLKVMALLVNNKSSKLDPRKCSELTGTQIHR